jgi:hypothetical protein
MKSFIGSMILVLVCPCWLCAQSSYYDQQAQEAVRTAISKVLASPPAAQIPASTTLKVQGIPLNGRPYVTEQSIPYGQPIPQLVPQLMPAMQTIPQYAQPAYAPQYGVPLVNGGASIHWSQPWREEYGPLPRVVYAPPGLRSIYGHPVLTLEQIRAMQGGYPAVSGVQVGYPMPNGYGYPAMMQEPYPVARELMDSRYNAPYQPYGYSQPVQPDARMYPAQPFPTIYGAPAYGYPQPVIPYQQSSYFYPTSGGMSYSYPASTGCGCSPGGCSAGGCGCWAGRPCTCGPNCQCPDCPYHPRPAHPIYPPSTTQQYGVPQQYMMPQQPLYEVPAEQFQGDSDTYRVCFGGGGSQFRVRVRGNFSWPWGWGGWSAPVVFGGWAPSWGGFSWGGPSWGGWYGPSWGGFSGGGGWPQQASYSIPQSNGYSWPQNGGNGFPSSFNFSPSFNYQLPSYSSGVPFNGGWGGNGGWSSRPSTFSGGFPSSFGGGCIGGSCSVGG